MDMHKALTAGVVGATGYTGQEMIRLLKGHPSLKLAFATSEADAGKSVAGNGLRYIPAGEARLGEVDVVFSCLPTGESGKWAVAAESAGALSIDLSADLREGQHGAVYGLPELWRAEVKAARLVANPGCYPTGVLLGMAPALGAGMVAAGRSVIVNAASGVTGAGRTAKRDLLFGEVAEDYKAYGVGNVHRHVPEIAAGLARLSVGTEFVFTPHLLPIRRGILETVYLPVSDGVTAASLRATTTAAYAGERFVEVHEELPSLKDVVGRNVVAIGFADVQHVTAPLVVMVVAFDNLLKGAAGQAIQNANLMLGLPEHEGLPQ